MGRGPPHPAERATAAWRQGTASAAWAATVRKRVRGGADRGGPPCQMFDLFPFLFQKQNQEQVLILCRH